MFNHKRRHIVVSISSGTHYLRGQVPNTIKESSTGPMNTVWYPSWQVQAGVAPIVPKYVDQVYLSMGKLDIVDGKPTVDGLQFPGGDEGTAIKDFVQACKNQGVKVVLSIGGHGSNLDYNDCWNNLTSDNVQEFGTMLASYCQEMGLDGIDFDWEPSQQYWDQAHGQLVGQLSQATKQAGEKLGLDLVTTLDVDLSTYWTNRAGWVLDAAGKGGLDGVNIMAYYDFSSQMTEWIDGWKNFTAPYGIDTSKVTVGMSSNLPDSVAQIASWAFDPEKGGGLSTGLWVWDPGQTAASNKITETIWNIYHSSSNAPAIAGS